jgi:AcrR family transcriptional regulator
VSETIEMAGVTGPAQLQFFDAADAALPGLKPHLPAWPRRLCTALDTTIQSRLSSAAQVVGGESQQGGPTGPGRADPERDRLIAAFGKAASEHGYRSLTVEQVARYAGTSSARVEAHFATKEEGIAAAQEVFFDRLWLDVLDACAETAAWPEKVRAALRTILVSLAEASALARVFTVEAKDASLVAAERQFAILDRFAELLSHGRRYFPVAASMPSSTERALIGGVASIVSGRLLDEEPQALMALEPELLELVLIPYVGREQARQLARQ